MVRLKNRYLLVHILYPTTPSPPDNPVPPTLLFNAPSPSSLTPSVLLAAVRSSVAQLYGDYGLGAISSSLAVKYLSQATSTAIVRVARNHYRMVWAAVTFLTEVAARECVVRVGRVCGTVRKAELEAVRGARKGVWRMRREIESGPGLVAGLRVSVGEEQGNWRTGNDGEDEEDGDDGEDGEDGEDEQGIRDADSGQDDEDNDDDKDDDKDRRDDDDGGGGHD
ncbi:MAG: hypothetical protein M1840_004158 [Geoglossum simile]|nr:MAG: hypothetical protein M1840_004158 [Geoglossum simile]